MTLPATARRAGPFNGNGVTTSFPFTFKVFAAADVQVVKAVSGVETTLVLNSDYTVTLNGDQDANPGGTITFPISGSALSSGQSLTFTGDIDYDQPLDLPSGGNFSPIALENQLDRTTMQLQQLKEELNRALTLPVSSTASTSLPLPSALKVIGWDSSASGLQNYDTADLFSAAVYANWVYDTFTGDGTTTAFALQKSPGNVANIDVSISGVTQMPGADYSLSGTTLTFTTAPANGVKVLARYGQAAQQVSTTFATEIKTATAGQTVFTLTSTTYIPGANTIAVYVNGLRLTPGTDFTETSGNVVTMISGLTLGDEVVFVCGTTINSATASSSVAYTPAGTGAVATTVQTKLREVVSVEDFGANETLTGDSAAIKAAIVAANGRPIVFQARRYFWDGTTITATNVRFWGGGMPTVNSARTALEGVGTIIQGNLTFTSLSAELRDMGVDRGSAAYATGNDALKFSPATYNAGRLVLLQNVVALGRDPTDAFHSILVEGYEHVSMENCTGALNMYCAAIKSRNVSINGFRAINGQNLMILKSDGSGAGSGSLSNVNVSNVTGEGSASTVYGLRVLSANVSINNLNISNINITGADQLLLIEAGAGTAIYNVTASNINGHDIRTFGLKTGGAGSFYNLNFCNINITDLSSRAAQFQGGGQYVVTDVYCSMKAGLTAQAADFFRVEAGVSNFRAEGLTLVENFGVGGTVPTLLLGSGRSITTLSNIRARVSGTLPLYGFSSQDATGATTTLTPLFDLDRMRSFMKLSATANCTIVNITSTLPGGGALPEGYEISFLAISGFNFVFQHNTNVRTRAQVNVTLTLNSILTFVWGGSSWHQKDNT